MTLSPLSPLFGLQSLFPTTSRRNSGSQESVDIELTFITADRVRLPVPTQDFIQTVEITLTATGAWNVNIDIFAPDDVDVGTWPLEDILVGSSPNRYCELAVGRETGPKLRLVAYCPTYEISPRPTGTAIRLSLIPQGMRAAILDRRIITAGVGEVISDVVRRIATERGWPTRDVFGRDTIEATNPKGLERPLSSNGETDTAFINSTLRELASAADGHTGAYTCYFDPNGALHFHTPQFYTARIHSYTNYAEDTSEVLDFTIRDNQIFGLPFGGASSRFIGVDSFNSEIVEIVTSSALGVISGAPQIDVNVLPGNTAKIDLGDGVQAVIPITARTREELAQIASSRYDLFQRQALAAEMEVVGTPLPLPHDLIYFQYYRQGFKADDRRLHYLSGYYQIQEVKHMIDGGGWKTRYSLFRNGLKPGDAGRDGVTIIPTGKAKDTQKTTPSSGDSGSSHTEPPRGHFHGRGA